jgi:A/G-specific adenine glycosylase
LIALGHRRGNRTGAREINQALMDLGALVCRPRAPHCARCCWMFACRARQLSDPTAFPKARARPRRPHYEIAVGVIWRGRARSTDGEVLIAQRREGGLLGGLWEFPGGKREPGESLRRCCAREIWEEVGLRVCVGRKLMTIRHAYSHFRITLHVFECRPLGGSPRAFAVSSSRSTLSRRRIGESSRRCKGKVSRHNDAREAECIPGASESPRGVSAWSGG